MIIEVLKDTEFGEIAQKQPFRRSRSFKVATFDTNAKPECDLLGVSNVHSTVYYTVSDISRIIGQIFVVYRRVGLPLFHALIRGEPLTSGLRNLTERNYKRRCMVWCKAFFDILNHLSVTHA